MASIARVGEEIKIAPAPAPWLKEDWFERLEKSIERGANHLLSLQAEPGFWQGELEADTTLESDYIYYLHVLGKADPERGSLRLRPGEGVTGWVAENIQSRTCAFIWRWLARSTGNWCHRFPSN